MFYFCTPKKCLCFLLGCGHFTLEIIIKYHYTLPSTIIMPVKLLHQVMRNHGGGMIMKCNLYNSKRVEAHGIPEIWAGLFCSLHNSTIAVSDWFWNAQLWELWLLHSGLQKKGTQDRTQPSPAGSNRARASLKSHEDHDNEVINFCTWINECAHP